MNVDGKPFRSIWLDDSGALRIVDQTHLPYAFEVVELENLDAVADAISTMQVRGAPLIGVAAAFGLWRGMVEDPSDAGLERSCERLAATRPTAVNLRWGLSRVRGVLEPLPPASRAEAALAEARKMAEEDVETCRRIGTSGLEVLRSRWEAVGRPASLQVLTHCNAGWLATVDWGTALSPIYQAHDAGIPLHVWVDETRPRSQGLLTAWELAQHGVPHTVIVDNEGGHLMQHGQVHLCIVGSDRVTLGGDVCNKIGTYLKALAAFDNDIPFWAALPASTIDWSLEDASAIPIEERDAKEVHEVRGVAEGADVATAVRVTPSGSPALNHAFDVTPSRLVTGLITERGACEASRSGLLGLFPEHTWRVGDGAAGGTR